MFQSAPLTKARGDQHTQQEPRSGGRFNPLPSQKQGETPNPLRLVLPCACFNPLPSQKQGETIALFKGEEEPPVSIRSPHKSKGRLHPAAASSSGIWFQSAPLTKARGDTRRKSQSSSKSRFNPLPSQKQGETRRALRLGR